MLVYRTIAKKVFWEFDPIIMQNLSDILLLFCTPTCPPNHVSATQELVLTGPRSNTAHHDHCAIIFILKYLQPKLIPLFHYLHPEATFTPVIKTKK